MAEQNKSADAARSALAGSAERNKLTPYMAVVYGSTAAGPLRVYLASDVDELLRALAVPQAPHECTPEENARIDAQIAHDAELFEAGRQHAKRFPELLGLRPQAQAAPERSSALAAWEHAKSVSTGSDVVVNAEEARLIDAALAGGAAAAALRSSDASPSALHALLETLTTLEFEFLAQTGGDPESPLYTAAEKLHHIIAEAALKAVPAPTLLPKVASTVPELKDVVTVIRHSAEDIKCEKSAEEVFSYLDTIIAACDVLDDNLNLPPVQQMVDRFLAWRLPDDFNPDGGINFTRDFNEHTPYPMKHEPTGTNLFTATQAKAMVEHMLQVEAGAVPSDPAPKRWMVVMKRETNPTEIAIFDRYDEAAMYWDRAQTQWSDVYFCGIAYGPEGVGMSGERPALREARPLPSSPKKEGK